MEDDYGSNVNAGLEKNVRFRVSASERFCYKEFLRNPSGTNFFVRLREVSTLEDVHFKEVPLYCERFKANLHSVRFSQGSKMLWFPFMYMYGL